MILNPKHGWLDWDWDSLLVQGEDEIGCTPGHDGQDEGAEDLRLFDQMTPTKQTQGCSSTQQIQCASRPAGAILCPTKTVYLVKRRGKNV